MAALPETQIKAAGIAAEAAVAACPDLAIDQIEKVLLAYVEAFEAAQKPELQALSEAHYRDDRE